MALPSELGKGRRSQEQPRHEKKEQTRELADFLTLRKVKRLKPETEIPEPVKNKSGNVLVGLLHKSAEKSQTIVIFSPGFASSKDRPKIKYCCTALARAGIDAYRFDFSGNGDSEGRFEDATPRKLLDDLQCVRDHFATRYKKLFLVGFSLGGTLSLYSAATQTCAGVISVAAPIYRGTFEAQFSPEQLSQLRSVGFTLIPHQTPYGSVPFTVYERFFTEFAELDMLLAIPRISCPVLLVHGSADAVVPLRETEELFTRIPSKDLFLIGGADHRFSAPNHIDALAEEIVLFVRENS